MNIDGIHIDLSEQEPTISEFDAFHHCLEIKDCPGRTNNFTIGHVLAGGGIGKYKSCDLCYKIVAKTQDPES